MQKAEVSFSKIRNFLWPIHLKEHRKFVPMFCLFFLISLVHHIIRNMKIALVITLEDSGAQVIPYLKVMYVLPGALILTYFFTKLFNRFTREEVFYLIVGGFLIYFLIFTILLFPFNELLEIKFLTKYIQSNYLNGIGLTGFFATIRYWNISIFYTVAELWSTVVLSMLFWGFVNEITNMNEAKRFYSGFALGANFSSIFTGIFVNWISKLYLFNIPFYKENYQWVFYQLFSVIVLGVLIMLLFNYLTRKVLGITSFQISKQLDQRKERVSLRECFKFLKKSVYLQSILIITISYNLIWNLTDVIWSYKAKLVYSQSQAFNIYMGEVTFFTGVIATILGLVLSGNIIRKFGWYFGALVTPVVWLISGSLFYLGLIFEDLFYNDFFLYVLTNPANLVLLLGTIQISFGRGCKYTIYDATKEMSFIPLSENEKRKGKAVIDGVASRLGKSCGSIVYIPLLIVVGDIALVIPYVFAIFVTTIIIWIIAVNKLNKKAKFLFTDTETNVNIASEYYSDMLEKEKTV